jgi:(E)-4-hydroxy-3-methylbut-2-enyl-diphosphate synthase
MSSTAALLNTKQSFCNSLTSYSRFKTREVKIGNIGIGGNNPIRIQSMTTTDTMDTKATVEQCVRMINAGCEIIRLTAPSIKEAENLKNIKAELKSLGYETPLVADIHFTPNAAEVAAKIVEKVRVNPGNYADKKKFEVLEYTDETYFSELERIRTRFTPLVKICKEYGTAMRIGTNHGSLSDRILSRYGDTPLGMVESAMEFLRICRDNDYHEIVLSMKASNPKVMVEAYRLLVSKMLELGWDYPLHLGVTEAGDGEDGRIKSAVGIGTLLEDGLGDTVRVSLTEDPEFEIPVARDLVNRYAKRKSHDYIPEISADIIEKGIYKPYEYNKRPTNNIENIGGDNVPVVVADLTAEKSIVPASLFNLGYNYSVKLDKWNIADNACDYIYLGDHNISFEIPGTLGIIQNTKTWDKNKERHYPLFIANEIFEHKNSEVINFVEVYNNHLTNDFLDKIKSLKNVVFIFNTQNEHAFADLRSMFFKLIENDCDFPVIVSRNYSSLTNDEFQLYSATDFGGLLVDGFGNGIKINTIDCSSKQFNTQTAFGILQATRSRISKTEYISCPSCGRTLFDLQETTAKIRKRTHHLKGVKIGIMGCIVNGPGEMADADYGYVGTGVGKITLYKGKEVVKRSIAAENAVDELIELIKEHGDWVEMKMED